MKQMSSAATGLSKIAALMISGFVLVMSPACNKDDDNTTTIPPSSQSLKNFQQTNLVSDNGTGGRTDANLVNGWGIAINPTTGSIWIAAEGTGSNVTYNQDGAELLPVISIPSATSLTGGAPTGVVYNGTSDFSIAANVPKFIFVGTDGVISAWYAGTAAVRVVDRSSTAAYTGLALASNAGANYLYAANFKEGKIDVFDKNYAMVSMTFTDPNLPEGYAPFNVQAIDGKLYVLYAKVGADGEEERGVGNGYVDIFNTDGSFVSRFATTGQLNAPWGVAKAPSTFFGDTSTIQGAILVGNFGDGYINAYNSSGTYLGQLKNTNGDLIQIDGLWGISFSTAAGADPNRLFFAAGPQDEAHGLFGYVKK